jgi:hypothetical protein
MSVQISPEQSDSAEMSLKDRLLFEKLAHYFCNQKKNPLTSRELAYSILRHEHGAHFASISNRK